MDRSLVSCFLLTVLCAVLVGCQEQPADAKAAGCCPQEMCLFVFDRLEEQIQRSRILEEALRRMASLLSSNEQFVALSSTLKADPVVGSLFLAHESNAVPDSPDWRVVDPLLSLVPDESKLESTSQGGRTKRQASNNTILIAREKVASALQQARLRSMISRSPTTSVGDDIDKAEGLNLLARMIFQATTARSAISRQPRELVDELDILNTPTSAPFDSLDSQTTTSTSATPTTTAPARTETTKSNTEEWITPTTPATTSTSATPTTTAPAITKTTKSNTKEWIIPTTPEPKPQKATQEIVKESVDNLQSAAKCALSQRNDFNPTEFLGLLSGSQATLNPNGTITVEFELTTCQKHFAAVWLLLEDRRITPIVYNPMRNKRMNDPSSAILQVPKDCLTQRGSVFSLTWPSPAHRSCSFPLIPLMECRVYSIDIIPIFQGFQGQSQTVTFTVPPLFTDFNNGSLPEPATSLSLSSLTATPRMDSSVGVNLQWSVQSEECAQLISSVDVKIYEDGAENPSRSYTVPAECFSKPGWTSFSVENDYCNTAVAGMPLEKCRNYKVEVEPKYSSTWNGRSSFVDYFSAATEENSCCNYLTSSSGSFQSVNYDGKFDCSWLISVELQNVIWLTFSQFQSSYYHVKVYDGPTATSNLLLDHHGYQPPQPVRSSNNKLFVSLARRSSYRQSHGKYFTAYYSAVPNTGRPFVSGCGGFIYGSGTISKPAYPSTENSTSECIWYIESNSNAAVALTNQGGKSSFPTLVYDGWSEEGGLVVYNQSSTPKAAIYSLSSKMLVKFPSWNSADRDRTYSWSVQNVYNNASGQPCSYSLTASSGTIKSPNYPSTYTKSADCRWVIQANSTSKVRLTFGYFDTEQDYDFVVIYDGASIFSPVLSELSGSVTSPITVSSSANLMTVRFVTNAYTDTNNNGYSSHQHRGNVAVGSRSGFLALYSTVRCDTAS